MTDLYKHFLYRMWRRNCRERELFRQETISFEKYVAENEKWLEDNFLANSVIRYLHKNKFRFTTIVKSVFGQQSIMTCPKITTCQI